MGRAAAGTRRAALAALLVTAVGWQVPATASGAVVVRKNAKDLTVAERTAFVKAVVKLKKTKSPYASRWKVAGGRWEQRDGDNISYYDQFVLWHHRLYECQFGAALGDRHLTDPGMRGHAGPMFLPWHRQFLRMFEQALQEVSGEPIAVPYWDWKYDRASDPVLNASFMGGDGDPAAQYVVGGFLHRKQWEVTIQPQGAAFASSNPRWVTRRFGHFGGRAVQLPGLGEIRRALLSEHYDRPPYNAKSPTDEYNNAGEPVVTPEGSSFRSKLEGDGMQNELWRYDRIPCLPDGFSMPIGGAHLHNVVHMWVGGTLEPTRARPGQVFGTLVPSTSPNDPLFFLHHSQIDRIWASWQRLPGDRDYQPRREDGGSYDGNYADDTMFPFREEDGTDPGVQVSPRQVERTQDLGYVYDDYVEPASTATAGPAATVGGAASASGSRTAATDAWFRAYCRLLGIDPDAPGAGVRALP